MQKMPRLSMILLGSIFLLASGCGDLAPLWSQESKLESLTLYFSDPLEFTVDFNSPEPEVSCMLEMAITYDVGINRRMLPLYITLENPEEAQRVQEFYTEIQLREAEEWLGIPEDNGVDYTLTHIAAQKLKLKPDTPYTLKIFANDDDSEKIYGVVKVSARLYPQPEIEQG